MSARAPRKSERPFPAGKPRRRSARATYRHGNLKDALLEEAIHLMSERLDTSFFLREVAQRIGVSHTAAYRHFPSKAALLAELACRGFETLTKALTEARAAGGRAEDVIRRQARTYVQVALEFPSHFRCMFGPHAFDQADTQRVQERCDQAFQCFVASARALPGVAASPRREADVTLSLWSSVHGLAHLAIDGQLSEFEKNSGADRFAAAIENVMTVVLNGFRSEDR